MKLKNYTSTVNAEKTISQIEQLLSQAGAVSVHKTYEKGQVTALSFAIRKNEQTIPIAMPVKIDAVYRRFCQERKSRPTQAQANALYEQAKRTAWRVLYDWLQVQLTLIELGQAELAQVFLPYMLSDRGETFYSLFQASRLRALPPPTPEETDGADDSD